MSGSSITAALNLMRRLPPQDCVKNFVGLSHLLPDATEELLQRIDQPLKAIWDTEAHRYFVASDYNRDGNSHRSPWTSQYFPPVSDGFVPPPHLRRLEVMYNAIFDAYRHAYYDGGSSSVNLWELAGDGFAGAFVIHKEIEEGYGLKRGCWDAIHIAEVTTTSNQVYYKITTTIILSLIVESDETGEFDLGGHITRQAEQHRKIADVSDSIHHISHLGKMIEDMELSIRKSFDNIYVSKTREVIAGIRSLEPEKDAIRSVRVREMLLEAVSKRGSIP